MLSIRSLIWDDWNIKHIARHRVTSEEVGQVCHGRPETSMTYGRRIRVIGLTERRRMLTVILGPTSEKGVYYPITARPSDKKERHRYSNHN
jgi:uncharacterized DUF497 family protein